MSVVKGSEPRNVEDIMLRYLISPPIRFAIVDLIRKKGKKYMAEISNELGINRKLISYHLRVLERQNLITIDLMLKILAGGRPVYVCYVELTDLTRGILEKHSI